MSVLEIEGFEKYSSLNDILSHYKYANYQTPVILSSTDTTGVIPRNNLSCLKMTSTQQAINIGIQQRAIRFPKFGMQEIPLHTNGVLGFSYYSYVPTGGSFAPFTPIAAVCDPTGKPHFFICINVNRQVELRRWNTSASMGTNASISAASYTWNSDIFGSIPGGGYYCDKNYFIYQNWVSTPVSSSADNCDGYNLTWNSSVANSNAFTLVHTSTGALNASSWNYIEVEYVISSSSTGSFKVRINNLPSDNSNTVDSQVTNVITTTQSNGNVGQVAFGTFWAHRADGAGSFYSDKAFNTTTHWITYFDDIYLLRKDSTLPNNFLGSVSCLKGDFDTLVSNTASSGNLASINDATVSASGHMTNRVVINNYNQNIQVRCSGLVVGDSTNVKFVQPVVLGYDLSNVPLKVRATLNSTSSDSDMVLEGNTITGNAKLGPAFAVDPSNNNWTGSGVKNTIFLFGA